MSGFFRELFRFSTYKRTQGQLVRKLTMLGIVVLFAWGALRFINPQIGFLFYASRGDTAAQWVYGTAGLVALIGMWLAFRAVNFPRFADFLIAVEAEMVKVSWPSAKELYITTVVVITVMLIITMSLFCFDFILLNLYRTLLSLATGGA